MLVNAIGRNGIGPMTCVVVGTDHPSVVGAVTRWGVVGADHTLLGQGGPEMLTGGHDESSVALDATDLKIKRTVLGWVMAFQRKVMAVVMDASDPAGEEVASKDKETASMYGYVLANRHPAPKKEDRPAPNNTPTHRLVSGYGGVLGIANLDTGAIDMFYVVIRTNVKGQEYPGTLYDAASGRPVMERITLTEVCDSLGIRLLNDGQPGSPHGKMADMFARFAAQTTSKVTAGDSKGSTAANQGCLSKAEADEVIRRLTPPNPEVYAGLEDHEVLSMAKRAIEGINEAFNNHHFHPSVVKRLKGWVREWHSVHRRHSLVFGETAPSRAKKVSPNKAAKKVASAQVREKMRGRK